MKVTGIFQEKDLEKIHDASVKILGETGVIFRHEETLNIFKEHGAKVNGEIVSIPPKMIENAMETAPSKFRFRARNDSNSITVGEESSCYVKGNRGEVFVSDLDKGRRAPTLIDLSNILKLIQSSDAIDIICCNPLDPQELDAKNKHLYIMYEAIKNTDKPVHVYNGGHAHITKEVLDMMEIAMGGRNVLDNNYCVNMSSTPDSPLAYSREMCTVIIELSKRNQVVSLVPCPMAGLSSPFNLVGSVLQQNAEILAGIVLTQLIKPGVPFICTPVGFAVNFRDAGCITGSPDANLMKMASIQLGVDFYHFPTALASAFIDARTLSYQAGYETMESMLTTLLSRPHVIDGMLGKLDSALTCSFEKFILDEEMYQRAKIIVKGIDFSDKLLSSEVDLIKEVGPGGTYLSHPSTVEHFRERWMPKVAIWDGYSKWIDQGAEDEIRRANRLYKERLTNSPESLLDPELDKDLKTYMDLHLK